MRRSAPLDAHAASLRPVDIELAGLFNDRDQLGKAIGPGVKVRSHMIETMTDLRQIDPVPLFLRRLHRLADQRNSL